MESCMDEVMERETNRTWAALLGCPGTKRKMYLEYAAVDMGLHILFIDWKAWNDGFWENWLAEHGAEGILKIDPPLWESAQLNAFPGLMEEYRGRLEALTKMAEDSRVRFLNHPRAIAALLDKRACKTKLWQEGLSVTEEIMPSGSAKKAFSPANGINGEFSISTHHNAKERVLPGTIKEDFFVRNAEQLLAVMETAGAGQVFIKPNLGSGALGVSAFRVQPRSGRMVLYTCAVWDSLHHCLVNTKKMQRMDDREGIIAFLNHLLELDCVIERWYAKAEHSGYTYDLRGVIQDGKMDFLLARLSKGPVTNLHLNNHPLPVKDLNLPASVLDSVEELCRSAVNLYPGIRSAGIDVLLEKGSLRPRIIEMNGQGDLIYQDIYQENRIYRHQIAMMAG